MTLTTHAVVGAALATAVPTHPVLAFGLGFCSHFLLDAIPHWDYSTNSFEEDKENPMNNDMKIGKSFLFDLCKISLDFLLGFVLTFLFFGRLGNFSLDVTLFSGALGAVLPDALQFLYFKWRHEPAISIQKFYLWIHSKKELKDEPLIGISSQIVFVALIVLLQKVFTR